MIRAAQAARTAAEFSEAMRRLSDALGTPMAESAADIARLRSLLGHRSLRRSVVVTGSDGVTRRVVR